MKLRLTTLSLGFAITIGIAGCASEGVGDSTDVAPSAIGASDQEATSQQATGSSTKPSGSGSK